MLYFMYIQAGFFSFYTTQFAVEQIIVKKQNKNKSKKYVLAKQRKQVPFGDPSGHMTYLQAAGTDICQSQQNFSKEFVDHIAIQASAALNEMKSLLIRAKTLLFTKQEPV